MIKSEKMVNLGPAMLRELSNNLLTLWFPDGSFYPGQIELRKVYKNLK